MNVTRRRSLALGLILVGLLARPAVPGSHAQDATPAAGAYPMPPGVTYDGLAYSEVTTPWRGGADVGLFRARLEPGAKIDLAPESTPLRYLVYVESGTITFRVDGPAQISRAAAGTPAAQAPGNVTPEPAAAMTDVTLRQGDAGVFALSANGVAGQARNDGPAPVEALVVMLAPPDADASTSATPASS